MKVNSILNIEIIFIHFGFEMYATKERDRKRKRFVYADRLTSFN